jgi:hypothetical protein
MFLFVALHVLQFSAGNRNLVGCQDGTLSEPSARIENLYCGKIAFEMFIVRCKPAKLSVRAIAGSQKLLIA